MRTSTGRWAVSDGKRTISMLLSIFETHQDESPLHPPLPLLRLVPREELDAPRGRVGIVLQGGEGRHRQQGVHQPEHRHGVVVVPGVRPGEIVSGVRHEQHDQDAPLRLEEISAPPPSVEERRQPFQKRRRRHRHDADGIATVVFFLLVRVLEVVLVWFVWLRSGRSRPFDARSDIDIVITDSVGAVPRIDSLQHQCRIGPKHEAPGNVRCRGIPRERLSNADPAVEQEE